MAREVPKSIPPRLRNGDAAGCARSAHRRRDRKGTPRPDTSTAAWTAGPEQLDGRVTAILRDEDPATMTSTIAIQRRRRKSRNCAPRPARVVPVVDMDCLPLAQSSARVISNPPSMVAARLYRNEPSVASEVKITTSTQAISAVTPITFWVFT